nr:ATP-dependent RNA helicase SUV3 homolog, mitochondrial [Parasteatoda tepidariorum]
MNSSVYACRNYVTCFNKCVLPISTSRLFNYKRLAPIYSYKITPFRWKSDKDDISSIVIPVPVAPANNVDDINIGEELSTKINKVDILKLINKFFKQPEITIIAAENGIDSKLYHKAAISFRKFCTESPQLPVDLHIVFSDILQEAGHITDILPYFLKHTREIFPHLECIEELKKICDLSAPPEWYPNARERENKRRLIFHAGPTNSGKTYRALERFITSESGVYCGPLKLLSVEVFNKTNDKGTPCDLVTGEERKTVLPENKEANHVACTIEMVSADKKYEVAVIDEIQMIKDQGRGWAWTRALLGIDADEIHICGEEAAIDLVRDIANSCGEELEIRRYERLTPLTLENRALMDLNNIQPGDCIVCFNKNDIFNVSLELDKKGFECAVIYGGLPPGTKLAQAKKFNDPNHPCKILVATDAIGMGLNLSIRRIIFYSLMKPVINEKGEKEIDTISISQALQIGGRAGRFNTQFSEGYVTTYRAEDLDTLTKLMSKENQVLEKAGLHPTADQIEEFAYHLPQATLSNIIDIFNSLCVINSSSYFMCDTEGFKALADMIQGIPLPLRARYVFCCAPINRRQLYVCTMFQKFSRQYSQNDPLTIEKLCRTIGWPFSSPQNISDLVHQEAVFDVLDLYLWLSYRFPDLFPDGSPVRDIQKELDELIQQGVFNITHLLQASSRNDAGEDSESHYPYRRNASSESNALDTTEFESGFREKSLGKGRLTKELLDKGLITPEMLQTLQEEWIEETQSSPFSSPTNRRKFSKVHTRRSKKKDF